jgi:hypothetical protein
VGFPVEIAQRDAWLHDRHPSHRITRAPFIGDRSSIRAPSHTAVPATL